MIEKQLQQYLPDAAESSSLAVAPSCHHRTYNRFAVWPGNARDIGGKHASAKHYDFEGGIGQS